MLKLVITTSCEVIKILPRKIITTSVSGTIFAIFLGLASPNPFGDKNINSFLDHIFSAVLSTPMYMLYSFPVIMIYGVTTSIISDKIGEFLSLKADNNSIEIIVSAALHIGFGLILLWISLGASILFFITDRILIKLNNRYGWKVAFKSLAIPVLTWLVFMGIFMVNSLTI